MAENWHKSLTKWRGRVLCTKEDCLCGVVPRCSVKSIPDDTNSSLIPYICTRKAGHKGNHVACSTTIGNYDERRHNYLAWRKDTAEKKDIVPVTPPTILPCTESDAVCTGEGEGKRFADPDQSKLQDLYEYDESGDDEDKKWSCKTCIYKEESYEWCEAECSRYKE